MTHPLVKLAKDAVERYIRDNRVLDVKDSELTADLKEKAGVFVCLKVRGRLRGCIGTFQPAEPDIAHETVKNAVSAATCDHRFPCVQKDELDAIEYSVDVLTPPEKVTDKNALDPRKYGVIVQAGGKRGLLLPDLDGVDTVDYQISIAMQKAGIPSGSAVELYRFEVQRYQ